MFRWFLFAFLIGALALFAEDDPDEPGVGVSANPGAINITTGTGELGRFLGIHKNSGFRLGGVWLGDYNWLMSGHSDTNDNRRWTGNSLFILEAHVDLDKAFCWKGGSFGIDFLQFNGQPTNDDAGSVQGYNSLPGPPPLNRSELYQVWLRHEFLEDKLVLRIGKTVPTDDFNNVLRPVPTQDKGLSIPAVSGLIYTPIFVNTTLLGAIPGYYNSAYGVTATFAPIKEFYLSAGGYDGNLARGVQIGLRGPRLNGYYFTIAEVGGSWLTPRQKRPGSLGIGGWRQTGRLTAGGQTENGTGGFYLFGSQALWLKNSCYAQN